MDSLLVYNTSSSSSSSDVDDQHVEQDSNEEAQDEAEQPSKRPRVAQEPQMAAPPWTLDDWQAPGLNPLNQPAAGEGIAEKHQGRVRSFPHVEGNYPTHVYISVEVPEDAQKPLEDFLQQVKALLPALEPVQQLANGAQAGPANSSARPGSGGSSSGSKAGSKQSSSLAQGLYHISLSRTVAVRYHQIASLVEALKEQLRKLDTFSIAIGQPEVLVNDDRTRTFLSLSAAATPTPTSVHRGTRHAPAAAPADFAAHTASPLLRAIEATNRAFQMHGLPRFYTEPRPHISVAWLLGDCEAQLGGALGAKAAQEASTRLGQCSWRAQVDKMQCKAGQKTFVVWEAKK